jgi:hypothetical protein
MPSTVRPSPQRRASRSRLAALGVAALALVAACQPVKNSGPPAPGLPQVYCAPSAPDTAAEYQQAFDGLRAFNTGGWIANDGGYPFELGDGRVLWLFGDTLLGLSPGGPVKTLLGIANNGFVVQDGRCFRPMTEPVPDPDLPGDHWIWPTGAVVVNDEVLVFGLHMQRTPADPPFDFALVDVDVTRFSLSDLTNLGTEHLPLDPAPTYGTAVLYDEAENYVYAYGGAVTAGVAEQYVARARPAQLFQAEAWEFWNGTNFVPDGPGVIVAPMLFDGAGDGAPTPGEAPISGFPVTKNPNPNGGYLGSAFPADLTDTRFIETWEADGPAGPWIHVATPAVDTTSFSGNPEPGRFVYGGRVIVDLPGTPFGLWSTHHEDFDQVLQNPALYKVWFAPANAASIP